MTAMMKSICTVLAATAMMMAPISAEAEEPGIEETIAYIKERCEIPNEPQRLMQKIEIDKSGLFRVETTENYHGEKKWDVHRTFDLKQVELSPSGDAGTISYDCGMAECVKRENAHSVYDKDAHVWFPKWSTVETFNVGTLECSSREAAIKAFKHLQRLLGGARIVRDPFAD